MVLGYPTDHAQHVKVRSGARVSMWRRTRGSARGLISQALDETKHLASRKWCEFRRSRKKRHRGADTAQKSKVVQRDEQLWRKKHRGYRISWRFFSRRTLTRRSVSLLRGSEDSADVGSPVHQEAG